MQAVKANVLAALKANHGFGHGLAAGFAHHAGKQARRFRHGIGGLGPGKKILHGQAEQGLLPGIARHVALVHAQAETQGASALTVKKRIGMLAHRAKHQIALARRAPQQALDGIHPAGVVLRYAHQLAIRHGSQTGVLAQGFHSANANGQTGAKMPMKMDSAQVFTGNGTVVSVDAAAKKIVLAHAPIAALGWPAMTMGFAVEDPSLLSGLQQGQKVRFDFRTQNNAAVIVDIEPLN